MLSQVMPFHIINLALWDESKYKSLSKKNGNTLIKKIHSIMLFCESISIVKCFLKFLFQLTKIEKLLLWFTAFEVHEEEELELVVDWEASFTELFRPFALSSMAGGSLIDSLLEWLDAIPEMFDVKVLKSPTSPEVAGDEVVLVGELDEVVCKLSLLWGDKLVYDEVCWDKLVWFDTFSGWAPEEQLLTLESVGNGNSSK